MPPKASSSNGSPSNNAHLLDMLAQQQCAPIARHIDAGNPQAAVKSADVLLSNHSAQSSHPYARALRAHALVSLHRQSDALADVEHVVSHSPKQTLYAAQILGVLCSALDRMGQGARAADLLDEANKAVPANEVLGQKAFQAAMKQQDYLRAQQIAARLAKAIPTPPAASSSPPTYSSVRNRYFWWSIQSYLLLATETPQAQGANLALTLAERMIEKHLASEEGKFDEKSDQDVQLFVAVLLEQAEQSKKEEKKRQALDILSQEPGRSICARSLGLGQLRRDLLKHCGEWTALRDETRALMEGGDGNWMTIEKWIEAEVALAPSVHDQAAINFLAPFLQKEGKTRREYPLAAIALLHEQRKADKASQLDLSGPLADYVAAFGRKACCFEDLLPFVDALSSHEAKDLLKALPEAVPETFSTEDEVVRAVNHTKLRHRLRGITGSQDGRPESPSSEVQALLQSFYASMPCSSKVPKTVPRPGSDWVLLAAQIALACLQPTASAPPLVLLNLSALLSHATQQASPASYPLKLLLLRLYLLLDCPALARGVWKDLKIRSVQNESLAWLWAEDGGLINSIDVDTGKGAGDEWRREAQGLYNEVKGELPKLISTAMQRGNYSSVREFLDFAKRVEGSGHQAALRLAEAREEAQRAVGRDSGSGWEKANAALHEVAGRVKEDLYDQADRSVLPSFAASSIPSLATLSSKQGSGSQQGADEEQGSAKRCPPAFALQASYLSAWYGQDQVEVPDPLRLTPQLNARLDEGERLFATCITAIQSGVKDDLEAKVRTFASHVEKHVIGDSAADTLPWRQTHFITRLIDLYLLARARSSAQPDVGNEVTSLLTPTLRSLSTSLAQQKGANLPFLAQAAAAPSSSESGDKSMNAIIHAVLQAQKGGQGVKEKVVKDVKEEVAKRRRTLAMRIEGVLKGA
ncbi:hypothetical protein BDZ90DRAFT_229488 [Jaminaea rosea]|uniref:Actin cytoskeleton organization protein n=1 Tax=Jaminaea rosea TaxID=1569628 RepID=A0A316UYS7_9BASI|nr:hypothetical protein BDZ90DRAFT_229488 [Jaminaea rosea]PWN30467.1 hypothetical protein BDZ90DRAFT_229488 [Jaminaea rosea]